MCPLSTTHDSTQPNTSSKSTKNQLIGARETLLNLNLLKVLKAHSKVLKDPAPFVLFKEFSESGLDFMLYFWVDLSTTSSIKVASDMRHHILSLFRQEGVDIPYPQMDVRFPAAPERGGAVPKPPKPKAEGNASAS